MVGLMLIAIAIMIVTGISAWLVTIRTQKRMKGSLGRKATDLEMVSLSTWMRVDEIERSNQQGEPKPPR